jgi:cytochrome c-type biogenesis protein
LHIFQNRFRLDSGREDYVLDISVGAAFVAGLLSFFSPCVLPIVPPYLAWLAGLSFAEVNDEDIAPNAQRRIFLATLFFVLGFSTVFILLGATASTVGQALARYFDILSIIAGAAIFVMGLHFLGVFRIALLYREARVNVEKKPAGAIGAYLMGLAFAFGWTPCVGPILAAILFVAAGRESASEGALLLAVYAAGIGIPFLLAGLFASRFIRFAGRFRKHMRKIEIAVGVMLVITGLLFMTGQMSRIAQWLIDTFPAFATIG